LISIEGVLIVGGIILLIVSFLRKKRTNEKQRKNEQEQQLNENNSTIRQQRQHQQEKKETVVIESVQNTITSFDETNINTTNSILLQRSQIEFKEIEVRKELGEVIQKRK
jgi:predicted histidine transporter YuiF (NhaC family)